MVEVRRIWTQTCGIIQWWILNIITAGYSTFPLCANVQSSIPDFQHKEEEALLYASSSLWWKWGESNSCPKTHPHNFLRGQSVIWISRRAARTDTLCRQVALFCMIGSSANGRCTCTTQMTLSPKPWYSSEERVTRRSRHCHLYANAQRLGSHSNSIVVVYF